MVACGGQELATVDIAADLRVYGAALKRPPSATAQRDIAADWTSHTSNTFREQPAIRSVPGSPEFRMALAGF
jgi:hypothetical protein